MAVTGDSRGDDGGDVGETRWMTYAELAQARGIREPAAVRLVQRREWERRPGNDGAARVAVPVSELRPSKPVAPADTPVAPDSRDMEALTRERQRADAAEARAERADALAATIVARLEQVEHARDEACQAREDARVQAAAAEAQVRGLREVLDEARRPAWRRWLGRSA